MSYEGVQISTVCLNDLTIYCSTLLLVINITLLRFSQIQAKHQIQITQAQSQIAAKKLYKYMSQPQTMFVKCKCVLTCLFTVYL